MSPVSRDGRDHPVRDLANAMVASIRDVQIPGGIDGDAAGPFNARSWQAVVPAGPEVPFPATVVITPFETLRMR